MPRFSIVIPTHRRADTLGFALETALAQTHPDFEVIVQNNGNDAATNDCIARFTSPRIVCRSSSTVLPMAENWEAALDASSGAFIAFIGDDDGIMPDACAICAELMNSRSSLGALHWKPHYYDWPNSLRAQARNRLVVNLPGPTAGAICNSRELLLQFYAGTIGWSDVPLIYNGSFVRRAVIDKVRAHCGGRYFAGQIPDVHSGIANLWAMEQFLHIDRALSICGASGHSNGTAHFVGSDGAALQQRFHDENPELHRKLIEYFHDTTNTELTVTSALLMAKELFFPEDSEIALNMRNLLQRVAAGANRDPSTYDQTISELHRVAQKYRIDLGDIALPPKRQTPEQPIQGPVADATGRTAHLVVNGALAGLATVADAVRLAGSMLPSPTPAQLNASLPQEPPQPPARPAEPATGPPDMVEGLRIPHVFWGLGKSPGAVDALNTIVARAGDTGDPRNGWFMADNLITLAHARGFLTDARFVAAVTAEQPSPHELAIVWRTHTLCWAAETCLTVAGDYVECGSYEGYSMAVVLRYLAGLPGRNCYLYDLFDPTGGKGEGNRLPAHAPELFERVRARFKGWQNVSVNRGKVPQILSQVAPRRIAFLHVDMNNAEAELGALDALFDRVTPGGIIVFDDYGWSAYHAQKQAIDAFMRHRRVPVLELPTGQGVVIRR